MDNIYVIGSQQTERGLLMREQDIVEILTNVLAQGKREIPRKTCSLECFTWKNEKWQKADRGMTTLFVLYWMINMCYADTGPQGGHGAADTEFSTLRCYPSTFELASSLRLLS